MSELKVNNISPVGSAIKINAPVGIKTAPPTTAGDSLYVSGNTDIEGSVEVVTVQAQNYGVRIKSPANNGTSILQFTNNSGTTERAAIYADNANALNFSTAGNLRASINSTGLLNVNGQSVFGGNATFNSPLVTINQLLDVNGKATFDTVVPEIPTTLTSSIIAPQHIVNKEYVDNTIRSSVRWIRFTPNYSTAPTILGRSDNNITVAPLSNGGTRWVITHNAGVSNYGTLVTGGRLNNGISQGDGLYTGFFLNSNQCQVEYSHGVGDAFNTQIIDSITCMILLP